ncbi:MAG: hypothetical protein IPG01_16705 [Chitinophagaceae bacterium]|nr:hypothetical protein [Chitinophagaceae bacterium]
MPGSTTMGLENRLLLLMNKLTNLREEGITDTASVHSRLQESMILFPGTYVLKGVDPINSEAELLLTATFFKYAEKIWGRHR